MSNALIELSNGFAEAVEFAGKAVVAVVEGGRNGVSGVIWREDLAVTTEHTIRGLDEVTVILPSGNKSNAKVAGRDPSIDIAILKLSESAAKAEFADAAQLKPGHLVLAIGRRGVEGLSASHGVVNATGAGWRTWRGGRVDRWLRLDLNPFPGFSGGPLIDGSGRVLGINTSGPRRQVVTIPNTTVDRIVDQLQKHGRVVRGYLGVGVQPVAFPAHIQQLLRLERNRGLLVITVANNSPAEIAGLLIGDIIVAIEEQAVADVSDLQSALDPEQLGRAVNVRLVRGGALNDVKLTVGERNGG